VSLDAARAVRVFTHGGQLGLKAAAEYLLAASQREVPHDSGALEKSGDYVVGDGEAVVGYRDPKAVAAHENLHVRHANDRKSKYLERPFRAEKAKLLQLIADEIKRELQ
jgi:hypothetical protein